MKSILVTGGAGFIGSCFVREALSTNKYQIITYDKLTYAGNLNAIPKPDNKQHVFVEADICDQLTMSETLAKYQPTWVVNFAAESHVDRSISKPDVFMQTNVIGVFRCMEASLKYFQSLNESNQKEFRFLQISTDEVYGQLGDTGSFTEKTAYDPSSPYSASKAAADHIVKSYHKTYGLPILVSHCGNNYGPFQNPEKLIPLMILRALGGEKLPVYGTGKNVRDWIHVSDHCDALMNILHGGKVGESYNIGAQCERTNLQVIELICDLLDKQSPLKIGPRNQLIQFVEDRPGHDWRYSLDTSKIRDELQWEPKRSFESGIQETIDWYLDNTTSPTKLTN